MGVHNLILAAHSAPPAPTWAPYSSYAGSIVFSAANNSYIDYAGSADWAVGTDDYTIEWWQWMTDNSHPNARIWSLNIWPHASFAVSIETSFLFWYNGTNSYYNTGISRSILLNNWHHIAICRVSGNTKFFLDGIQQGADFTTAYNITDTSSIFSIGNETSHDAAFDGYVTDFHWVKGTALYTGNFTLPVLPPTVGVDSKLLLLTTDSSHTVTDATGNHNLDYSDAGINWINYNQFAKTAWLDMSNPDSAPTGNGIWTDLTSFGSNGAFIGNIAVLSGDPSGGHCLDFGAPPAWQRFNSYNPLSTCSNKPPSASMNFWIKAQPSYSGYQFVGGSRSGNQGMYFLLLPSNLTEARVCVYGNTSYDININYTSYFNHWHFVSFVAQPTRTDLYIDGVNVGSNKTVSGNFGTMPAFSLGGEAQTSGGNPFTGGLMGYCTVYDRSLSAAEVLAEYTATKSYYGY
jgi:Concanavalin A-like lectin/glucanases superfamily